jgi:Dolichyl-phosphate-mannose-protein mannosyltransferase
LSSSVELAGLESSSPSDGTRGLFDSTLNRPAVQAACLAVLLLAAGLRIVSTYRVFNHTIDEASHIEGGIEWWQKGTYTLEAKHTPLARISVALGPYLAGARWTNPRSWTEAAPVLSANGSYWRNLTLGRMGVLPYFVIATLVVFFWTRRLLGAPAGLIAAAVFTQLPTVLTHSSVATTDLPLTAMLCWALYAFTRWLEQPSPKTGALFGVASGLALATKLSTLVFLPACALPIIVAYARTKNLNWRVLIRGLGVAALCAFLSVWAIYRFSHAPIASITHVPDRVASRVFGSSSRITGLVSSITRHVPLPAPELLDGVRFLRNQNNAGSRGFLFGHIKEGGWWYFFFVALGLKTPIAVLFLSAIGAIAVLLRYAKNTSDWQLIAPLSSFAMIMLVSMPSNLDSGVRYVLPVYVFMSTLAAAGTLFLWNSRKPILARCAVIVLLSWLTVSSALCHPDYLSFFNELGGKDPSRLIVIGDYDWGQDLTRLATYVREHSIQHITIAYDGFYVPEALGLANSEHLLCKANPSGWVAVEVRRARLYPECYPWLPKQNRVATVGKTMWVYYLQP